LARTLIGGAFGSAAQFADPLSTAIRLQ